jgi:two-component system, LuxR family, response regulator FixJ
MNNTMLTIGADVRCRASVSYCLNTNGFLAEPFKVIGEFIQRWPTAGIIQEIGRRYATLSVMAYSENSEPSRVVDGAAGDVNWPRCGNALIAAIRKPEDHSKTASSLRSRKAMALSQLEKLSCREREILAGMVEGLSARLTGGFLSISPRTVELHRGNILNKIGARRSAEAI